MEGDGQRNLWAVTRRQLRYTWILFLAAGLYLGWVALSRRRENQQAEEKAAAQRRNQDRQAFESMGGSRFEILNFYASPGLRRRGETAQLCYGVSNARTVRIDPPVGTTWPSLSRCLDVRPAKETTYTLTAEDGKGNTRTAAVTVKVQ